MSNILKEIETSIIEVISHDMWLENTKNNIDNLKAKMDSVLEYYVKKGLIYNYYNKCDNENNFDGYLNIIDTYVQETKESPTMLNRISFTKTGEINKN